jgi:quinol monooxygenase YgiN
MKGYGRFGRLQAEKGKGDELASILMEASKVVSLATGCQIYLVGRDVNDSDCLWVYEVWRKRENHQNSLKLREVRELIAKSVPIIRTISETPFEFDVLGGKGLT